MAKEKDKARSTAMAKIHIHREGHPRLVPAALREPPALLEQPEEGAGPALAEDFRQDEPELGGRHCGAAPAPQPGVVMVQQVVRQDVFSP